MSSKDDNVNGETLISSKDDDHKNENEDNDETMDQNKKSKIIKGTNDLSDEIIDKSKPSKEQIKSLKKREDLKGYWPYDDFGDKELKFKYFKIELADMSNEIDKKLFEQIFGHTLIKLTDKLINTTSKEENQIIVNSINKNKEKLYRGDETSYDYLIQPGKERVDLIDAINLILNFNKTIQLDLI